MSLLRPTLLVIVAVVSALVAGDAVAQGFYYRTVQKNPMTGRQEILDLQRPRWTGDGQGGIMFDPSVGAMQIAAVSRSRFTGRLEYHNRYLNPWTGAQQSTSTAFNPFSQRYETLHKIEPPPAAPAPIAAAEEVVDTTPVKNKRRVRVIESKLEANAPLPSVSPGATAPDMIPGGVLPPQEQASSKTIEWNKNHPEATLNFKGEPKDEL
jgi:hypothetical protein